MWRVFSTTHIFIGCCLPLAAFANSPRYWGTSSAWFPVQTLVSKLSIDLSLLMVTPGSVRYVVCPSFRRWTAFGTGGRVWSSTPGIVTPSPSSTCHGWMRRRYSMSSSRDTTAASSWYCAPSKTMARSCHSLICRHLCKNENPGVMSRRSFAFMRSAALFCLRNEKRSMMSRSRQPQSVSPYQSTEKKSRCGGNGEKMCAKK